MEKSEYYIVFEKLLERGKLLKHMLTICQVSLTLLRPYGNVFLLTICFEI